MNKLLERCLRGSRFLVLIAVMLLAACGPGSGGTGTGPGPQMLTFSGSAGTGTAGVPAPTTPGTATGATDCVDCTRVDLQLQETTVELTTQCGRFVFTGDWTAQSGNIIVLPGRFDTATRSVGASLRLQFSDAPAASQQVTATVFDQAGQVLVGPVTLQRAGALPPRLAGGTCAP